MDSKTVETLQIENDTEDKYSRIAELSEELEESRVNKRIADESKFFDYSFGTWLTGLDNGTIVDFDFEDEQLMVIIRTSTEQVIRVPVSYSEEWDDSNEIVRLIQEKNTVGDDLIPLIGEDVTVKVDYWQLPSNNITEPHWSLHIPESLDLIGKLKHKYNTVSRFAGWETGFKPMSFLYWMFFFTVISMSLLIIANWLVISNDFGVSESQLWNITAVSLAVGCVVSFLSQLIERLGLLVKEKYHKYRSSNSLLN